MKMTLEKQFELETMIKEKGEWAAFKIRIAFLYKLYRADTLSEEQYLYQHKLSTLAFAGVTK